MSGIVQSSCHLPAGSVNTLVLTHVPLHSPPLGDKAATLTASPLPCCFCRVSSKSHLLWRQIPHSLLYVEPSVPQTGCRFLGQATQRVPSLPMPLEYWLQSTWESSTTSAPRSAPAQKGQTTQPPTSRSSARSSSREETQRYHFESAQAVRSRETSLQKFLITPSCWGPGEARHGGRIAVGETVPNEGI